jgi:phenylalanyl-tRNA synthetase beta chain
MTAFGAEVESVHTSAHVSNDSIFEINVTPNRPDWAGVRGVARDLAAVGMGTLKPLAFSRVKPSYQSPITISAATDGSSFCPQFIGRHVRGFKNCASPAWLQDLLKSADFEPHSALVDLTNFLSLDLCRPAHVYDASALAGPLTTRLSKAGESFKSLSDQAYTLPAGVGLIADGSGPLAVAGVIGGQRGSFQTTSKEAFLEIAYFQPSAVAYSGRILGITTDARYRFERGVDPAFLGEALEYLSSLIVEICGGEVSDVVAAGTSTYSARAIRLPLTAVAKLAGTEVALAKQTQILQALACTVSTTSDHLLVTTPSWRHDLSCAADLVEEIVRTIGYDTVPTVHLPARVRDVGTTRDRGIVQFSRGIRQHGAQSRRSLCARGYYETVTFSFLSSSAHPEFTSQDPDLAVVNPITVELDRVRSSIIPNLVDGAKSNILRSLKSGSFFEVGPVFVTQSGKVIENTNVAGIRFGYKDRKNWRAKDAVFNFFDVKADLELLLSELGFAEATFKAPNAPTPGLHPSRVAEIYIAGECVGIIGQLHPEYASKHEIGMDAIVFEVSLTNLLKLAQAKGNTHKYESSALLPVERDLSLLLETATPVGSVLDAIRSELKDRALRVDVFDLYEGPKLPAGKRAVGFTMLLKQSGSAYTSEQLDSICHSVVTAMGKQFGAELRS